MRTLLAFAIAIVASHTPESERDILYYITNNANITTLLRNSQPLELGFL